MLPLDYASYVASSARRLTEARLIADSVRRSATIHRLAMRAVFALEDCHEAFRRMQDEAVTAAFTRRTDVE